MTFHDGVQRVPGALAERLYTAIQRYRNAWSRYKRPEDLRQLLRIFPNVTISEGYLLDYVPMGGPKSGWIWPFAKPIQGADDDYLPDELSELARDQLSGMRDTPEGQRIAQQTLYRHLRYPGTQLGLFEYSLFVKELWATKSETKAEEWLNLGLLFSRQRFDGVIYKAQSAKRIRRPGVYEPTVRSDPAGGGKVQMLAYDSVAWKRIFSILLRVDKNGHVTSESGKVLVDLG